jgi:hypothetical protein
MARMARHIRSCGYGSTLTAVTSSSVARAAAVTFRFRMTLLLREFV